MEKLGMDINEDTKAVVLYDFISKNMKFEDYEILYDLTKADLVEKVEDK